ncbi:hypothetical protein CH253_16835 [Rhodococcus sp. 06-156-3C]|uniref:beta-ketoacyl synthase N-terminal-like domain-containing protein n=1 Tax=Nocardiaceae TaxID=85025 RepID=UPI0005230818|nr:MULTISPECIES: beta-ketoacyl synthase N-terminal-like domain-containing protein [Rhodococcus]OZD18152.1 hypothetical protein CH280_06160 [Rhodococcus sp. 06-156-4C]OZD18749.1 hypothetical protein CH253_16835 [Rhodococcus sp. 06-156-3C]OZD22259.1 hypothetical protein CH248_08420 [Rhodococcus sp. 06-156-4a]OZD34065.1 hypothetical protein CH247_08245 [Rhodococcus sp. 06-156-3b]OZD38802.1 hypothetical protein CH284_06665 [Rhodococcus sp. 06-156-3]
MNGKPTTFITDTAVLASSGAGMVPLGLTLEHQTVLSGDSRNSYQGLTTDHDGSVGASVPIPDFDIKDYIPGKGTRHLDRTTAISLAAATMLDLSAYSSSPEHIGIALGTIAGSVPASIELDIDVLTGVGSAGVNPKRFPNCTMNCAASQVAIRNNLKGPNSTTSAGIVSAFVAMRYAKRAITNGHAKQMIVGGIEELSDQIRWGIRKKQEIHDAVPISEASAMFVIESSDSVRESGRPPLGAVLSCETGFFDIASDSPSDRLTTIVERALRAARISASDVTIWAPGNRHTHLTDAEQRGCDEAGIEAQRVLDVRAALGETGSALGALQVLSVLSTSDGGGIGLITAIDPSGVIAAAVVERTR